MPRSHSSDESCEVKVMVITGIMKHVCSWFSSYRSVDINYPFGAEGAKRLKATSLYYLVYSYCSTSLCCGQS